MKIALVVHAFLPKIGGLEIYTYRLARDLNQNREDVRVLTTNWGVKQKEQFSFPVYYFRAWPVILRNPFSFALIWHLFKNQYDIIHLQSIWFWPSFWAALLKKRARIITTVHGVYPEKMNLPTQIGLILFKPLARFVLLRSDKAIVLSESEKEKLKKIFKISPKKIEIIPPGIEIHKSSKKIRDKLKKKYRLLDKKVILFTGRIIPEKNPQILIEALPYIKKEVKNIKILFVGPVEERFKRKLLSTAGKNQEDIVFTGHLYPVKEAAILANFYALSDIFVSLGEWEGLPARVLEAKAYGLPVVEEILNPEKLAQKILEILSKGKPQIPPYDFGNYSFKSVFNKIYQIYLKHKKEK